MMHESKGQRIGKATSLHLFHTTVDSILESRTCSHHAVINAVFVARGCVVLVNIGVWLHENRNITP